MMPSAAAPTMQPVLADLLPGARVRDAALVAGGASFLAMAAQVAVPLWFTPVPLSLGTFAVLLTGAALGPARGGLSIALYLAVGAVGAPVFAGGGSGWSSASFGYVVGYLLAAVVVGALARHRADRSAWSTAAAAAVGSVLIYAAGVPWLMSHLDVGLSTGLELGVYPFLVGDAVKAVAAALLLPGAWRLVDRAA